MSAKVLTERDFPAALNERFRPAITKLRCPSCGSRSFNLTEIVAAETTWEVSNGRLNREAGIHEFGQPQSVFGDCGCGHWWNVRCANLIDSVVTELDTETLAPLQTV